MAEFGLPSLRAGTLAMTDTPPAFAEDVRQCAGRRAGRPSPLEQPMPIRGEGRGGLREGVKLVIRSMCRNGKRVRRGPLGTRLGLPIQVRKSQPFPLRE